MTPRFRTAFSVPSGFTASVPRANAPAAQATASSAHRPTEANVRTYAKAKQEACSADRRNSEAA